MVSDLTAWDAAAARRLTGPHCARYGWLAFPLRLPGPGGWQASLGEAGRRSSLFYEVSGRCQTQLR